MKKCDCWKQKQKIVGWYGSNDPILTSWVQYCNGTKEQEECSCNGDQTKCNFYPEIREKAQLELNSKKVLNTIEMIQIAEKNGKTYKCLSNPVMFYNKQNKMFLSVKNYSDKPYFIKFDDLNYFLNYKWKMQEDTPIVIVISGSGGVGKSTFIKYCHEYDNRVTETSTVDFVKEIALKAGWNGEKDEKGRKFLSDLKDAMSEYDDIPNKKIEEVINYYKNNIIFVNAREPKNIQYLKDKYNALTLLITNKNVKKINSNHADKEVDNFKYDIIIENNGNKEDLKQKAKEFIEEYKNKGNRI